MVGGFALKVKLNFGVLYVIIGSYCTEEDAKELCLHARSEGTAFFKNYPIYQGIIYSSCHLSGYFS